MNSFRRLINSSFRRRLFHHSSLLKNDFYEPDYLEGMKSKVPLHDTLNIQLRGYDFPVLENYQKFVHNLMRTFDVSVEDAWAIPHQDIQVSCLKPASEIVNNVYDLKIYQRTVQITDVLSSQLPVIIRALEASTPAGVTLEIVNHEEYHEEVRYVPDTELLQLKQDLEDLGGPSKKK